MSRLKTNISIKFDTIEEYKEIEKVLEEIDFDTYTLEKYECGWVEFETMEKESRKYNSLEEFLAQ